jgi:hypothetical protein
MRLQSQLLSKKRFDEHLDPLPLGAYTTALKELDESGIHASHFTRKLLHGRHFNFNHTLGIGAKKSTTASRSPKEKKRQKAATQHTCLLPAERVITCLEEKT